MPEHLKATLARLTQRVDAIESMIGHNGGPPPDDEREDHRLSKRKLAQRWDVSTRTIDRTRKEDPKFPLAERDREGGPLFFWLSHIVRYEKQRAAHIQPLRYQERHTMKAARAALQRAPRRP